MPQLVFPQIEKAPEGARDIWDTLAGIIFADEYFTPVSIPSGSKPLKYWNGSSWVTKPLKYWNGISWVTKPLKYWNGSAWI